jgi:5-methylcytosine-specific restriction protein A
MTIKMLRPRVAAIDARTARPPAKLVDPYYQSSAHEAWAEAVKARAGHRCEDCGRGGPDVRLIADHIKERKDGGSPLDPANGRCRCGSCHTAKTAAERARRTAAAATGGHGV